jgi:hypothetical protein
MIVRRFFDNPQFLSSARLLHQLHRLIRDNQDETPEGEALRERMDEPAEHLTPEEVDALNAISADFYTLSGQTWEVLPSPPSAQEALKEVLEARERGDFIRALDLLRTNQKYHDAAALSYLRGKIWSEAGEKAIAEDFFRRAKELKGENGGA